MTTYRLDDYLREQDQLRMDYSETLAQYASRRMSWDDFVIARTRYYERVRRLGEFYMARLNTAQPTQ